VIGASKLNWEDVEQIRSLFSNTNMSDGEIAKKFGVSRIHINRIRNGKRWNEDNHTFVMKDYIAEDRIALGEPAPYYSINPNEEKKRGIFQSLCWKIGKFFLSLSDN